MNNIEQYYDLDHVFLSNGNIYRVLGNMRSKEYAPGDIMFTLQMRTVTERTMEKHKEIIKRRWAGLQLSEYIVSTIRFREKSIILPFELVQNTTIIQRNVVVTGKVLNAEMSNLFPRMFQIETEQWMYPVYILWWKFSTPAREHDHITICGDIFQTQTS